MDDRELKRAGLDYHEYASVRVHRDFDACRTALDGERERRWFAFTTEAPHSLYDARFAPGDALVFGCESSGLPEGVLADFGSGARLRIPMRPGVRSLNLSNAVAVAVYEAWRQLGLRRSLTRDGSVQSPLKDDDRLARRHAALGRRHPSRSRLRVLTRRARGPVREQRS